MAIVSGQGTSVQIGKESTWGTKATPTVALNFTSEDFRLIVDKAADDALIGATTDREMDIVKESVDWSLAVNAKPDNVGMLISAALGAEASPAAETGSSGVYKHVITPVGIGASVSLPSLTAVVNRIIATKAYTGLKVNTLRISAKSGDYVRMELSGKGKAEDAGSSVASLKVPALKNFRFVGAKFTFDGTDFGDVLSCDIEHVNNLDDGEQTSGSGLYGSETQPQKRETTVTLETFFNSASNTVRDNKYKVDSTATFVAKYESPSEATIGTPYSMEISIPLLVVTECHPVVAGPEKMKVTIAGRALESDTEKAISITLIDKSNTKFIS